MAKLEGYDLTGAKWLRIELLPAQDPDLDAMEYLIEVSPGPDSTVTSCRFSVAGWQSEHEDMWYIARSFAEIGGLLGAIVPMDRFRTGSGLNPELYERCGPMHIVWIGNPKRRAFSLRVFLETEMDSELFTLFFMITSLEQCVNFGLELEREICTASPLWARENKRSLNLDKRIA